MAVITGDDYYGLAVCYANARDTIVKGSDDLFDAVYLIVMLQSLKPEIDLLKPFWDTYNLSIDQLNSTTLFLGAIRELNAHVLREGGYESIDAFLLATGQTVPATFAELSAIAGYEIAPAYIE